MSKTKSQINRERYLTAMKRVQTAIEFSDNKKPLEAKHLRVGIDMSKSDMGGLAKLLIDKGIFTIEEYEEAMANQAEIEAESYALEIQEQSKDTKIII